MRGVKGLEETLNKGFPGNVPTYSLLFRSNLIFIDAWSLQKISKFYYFSFRVKDTFFEDQIL